MMPHLHFTLKKKKYLQTYLTALNTHFQPNRHLKIFTNSCSGHPAQISHISEKHFGGVSISTINVFAEYQLPEEG